MMVAVVLTVSAQQHSKKYAHITFPEEINAVYPTVSNAFA